MKISGFQIIVESESDDLSWLETSEKHCKDIRWIGNPSKNWNHLSVIQIYVSTRGRI